VAQALNRHGVDATALRAFDGGRLLGAADEDILAAATRDGRALVTFDLRTIPPLLKRWAETGERHAGVILVSASAMRPNDVRRVVRSLRRLADAADGGLEDQVLFLA
jgi:hypothetical protein